jgi:hypothetical protein
MNVSQKYLCGNWWDARFLFSPDGNGRLFRHKRTELAENRLTLCSAVNQPKSILVSTLI